MKQTFIAYIRDNAGNVITFERFACKRAATAKNNMLQLFSTDLYKAATKGAEAVEIYATPDGYHRNDKPELVFTV